MHLLHHLKLTIPISKLLTVTLHFHIGPQHRSRDAAHLIISKQSHKVIHLLKWIDQSLVRTRSKAVVCCSFEQNTVTLIVWYWLVRGMDSSV